MLNDLNDFELGEKLRRDEKKNSHLDSLWQESNVSTFISRLRKGEDIQSVIESQHSPERVSVLEEIQCSDGRCPHQGNEFSIAGSGILLSDEEFKVMIEQNPTIKTLTTHADCGAAKLAFAKAQENGQVPAGITTAEEFAIDWATKKAAQYNLVHRHIGIDEFVDPHHHERGIVVDATGVFHPSQVQGMPNMFVSQAASFADKSYIGAEADILTGIGTGDHAFGPRINPENPFYILVTADKDHTKDELVKALKASTARYGDKVKVEGLVIARQAS